MTTPIHPPRFPMLRTLVLLTLAALVLGWLLWQWLPLFFSAPDPPQVGRIRRVVRDSALIVWGAALLGLVPLFFLARRGVMATVAGYFIGSGIRLVLCLGAAVYLCVVQQQPSLPTALAMVGMYVPLLLLETLLVGRYLVSLDRSSSAPGDKTSDSANNHSLKETQA